MYRYRSLSVDLLSSELLWYLSAAVLYSILVFVCGPWQLTLDLYFRSVMKGRNDLPGVEDTVGGRTRNPTSAAELSMRVDGRWCFQGGWVRGQRQCEHNRRPLVLISTSCLFRCQKYLLLRSLIYHKKKPRKAFVLPVHEKVVAQVLPLLLLPQLELLTPQLHPHRNPTNH